MHDLAPPIGDEDTGTREPCDDVSRDDPLGFVLAERWHFRRELRRVRPGGFGVGWRQRDQHEVSTLPNRRVPDVAILQCRDVEVRNQIPLLQHRSLLTAGFSQKDSKVRSRSATREPDLSTNRYGTTTK